MFMGPCLLKAAGQAAMYVTTPCCHSLAVCCACRYEVDSFEQLAGSDARKVILFLAVMAVHAVGEGGGVGVSFAGDRGWAQVCGDAGVGGCSVSLSESISWCASNLYTWQQPCCLG